MFLSLPNAFGDAATNMALDASLLSSLPAGAAAFRHYGWTEPAMTFGYSQRWEEVRAIAPEGVRLCRRMTGGGIVDHRNDWTYALIIRSGSPAAEISSTELYAAVHRAIADALAHQNFETTLAPCPRKCDARPTKIEGPDQCFIQPVMNDVLNTEGVKIAGAAMKRTKEGLLLQGSIDRHPLGDRIDIEALAASFADHLTQALGLEREEPEDLRPLFSAEAIEREKSKFAGGDWLARR